MQRVTGGRNPKGRRGEVAEDRSKIQREIRKEDMRCRRGRVAERSKEEKREREAEGGDGERKTREERKQKGDSQV